MLPPGHSRNQGLYGQCGEPSNAVNHPYSCVSLVPIATKAGTHWPDRHPIYKYLTNN